MAGSQKDSNLHYRASATEYDPARQAVEEAIEVPKKDLSAIASAKRESAIEPANSRTLSQNSALSLDASAKWFIRDLVAG